MSWTLLSSGGLELDHQFSGHPSAVLHLDALRLCPLADFSAVHPARRCPASAPGWPPRTTPGPPRSLHIASQRIPQRLGMLGVQINLILATVQPEPDSAFGLAAIEVVDEQGLYLLSHRCPISLTDASSARSAKAHERNYCTSKCCERSQVCPEAVTPDRRSCPSPVPGAARHATVTPHRAHRHERSSRWILRPVRATVPLWREPPCRGGLSRHDAAGAPWRRFADGPARGAYGRAWSGVSAGAESPAGDPPPPTAGQPSWLKCLRIESSQVRTVACAFVVMRSMMASARIFSSMRSCHWLGGSWVQ